MGIMNNRSSLWVAVAVLMSVALVPMLVMAGDSDPLQDFCMRRRHRHQPSMASLASLPTRYLCGTSGLTPLSSRATPTISTWPR